MPHRRLLFAALSALLVLGGAAAGGEIVARALGAKPYGHRTALLPWAEPHPVLGWANREGVHRADDPGRSEMAFWAGGRRASRPDETLPKESSLRAVLVGGSWFQGFGVVDRETFAWRLGELLPYARFDNYGTGGYGTLQSLMRVELVARTTDPAPDLLVYGFASFHDVRNVQTYQWASGLRDRSGQRLAPPRASIEAGRVVRHPPGALPDWPLERLSGLVAALHEAWFRHALRDRNAQVQPVTQRLLWQMQQAADQIGSRLLVMLIYGFDELDPYVLDMARRRVDFVDCRYPEDPRQRRLRVGGTGHPNAIVHDYWARCLAARIEGRSPPQRPPASSTQASPRR